MSKRFRKALEEIIGAENIDLISVPGYEDEVAIIRDKSQATVGFPVYLQIANSKGKVIIRGVNYEKRPIDRFTIVCACCVGKPLLLSIEHVCESVGIKTIILRSARDFNPEFGLKGREVHSMIIEQKNLASAKKLKAPFGKFKGLFVIE